jgi:hypothetical protein
MEWMRDDRSRAVPTDIADAVAEAMAGTRAHPAGEQAHADDQAPNHDQDGPPDA